MVWSRLKKALPPAVMRWKRTGLFLFFFVLFVTAAAYLLLVASNGHPAVSANIAYQVGTLACYTALWFFISDLFKNDDVISKKIFWQILVVGIVCAGVTQLVLLIPGGFDETGQALSTSTLVETILSFPPEAIASFVLLLSLRRLTLYRRTKSSERNWYIMLGCMSVTSLATYCFPISTGQDWPQWAMGLWLLSGLLSIAFMAINSLRISWIVRLSFKDKMKTLLFTVLLLLFLGLRSIYVGPNGYPLEQAYAGIYVYSPPLGIFLILANIFGIIYCTTSLLSLLFHLPTTGEFQRRDIGMAAMSSLTDIDNPEKLAQTITVSAVDSGSGTLGWLAMTDPETNSLEPHVLAMHKVDPIIANNHIDTAAFFQEIRSTKQPILVKQAMEDKRISVKSGDSIRSLLVCPLVAHNQIMGVLFVASNVTYGFEKDDVEAITTVAGQGAVKLQNAQLFEAKVDRERLVSKLDIARSAQKKLLPQQLPQMRGLSLFASSEPAQEVGGDYYDFVQLDENRLAFIVADVSGKGTSAAFYMAEMQGIFRSVTYLAPEPTDFLTHANRAICSILEKNIFISVIYGLLDLQEEKLSIARAGHCPAAVVSSTGEGRYLRPGGMGLGMDRGKLFRSSLEVEHIPLRAGDSFVLYTDGVVESRNTSGEEYDFDRLLNSICQHQHKQVADLHNALIDDLKCFIGEGNHYNDDLTLVVLKWHGQGDEQIPYNPI